MPKGANGGRVEHVAGGAHHIHFAFIREIAFSGVGGGGLRDDDGLARRETGEAGDVKRAGIASGGRDGDLNGGQGQARDIGEPAPTTIEALDAAFAQTPAGVPKEALA